jgi:hypothetical protein
LGAASKPRPHAIGCPGSPPPLVDPAEATRQFWPTIARFGLPYNLIILQSVGAGDRRLKEALAGDWTAKMESVWQAGSPYHWHIVTAAMQMTMFRHLPRTHPVRPSWPCTLPIPGSRARPRSSISGN